MEDFNKNKIYTKTGDNGLTSLIGGKRVPKYHLRVEAYGTVDELCSYIGLVRDQDIDENSLNALVYIQKQLFVVESLLAVFEKDTSVEHPTFAIEDISFLEKEIDKMQEILTDLNSFILPGGDTTVSFCHIARTVCRRAERIIVKLAEKETVDKLIIIYLNRLSDYLFVLARYIAHKKGASVISWRPF